MKELSPAAKAALADYARSTRIADPDREAIFGRLETSIHAGGDEAFLAELDQPKAQPPGWSHRLAWAGVGAVAAAVLLWGVAALGGLDGARGVADEDTAPEAAAYDANRQPPDTAAAESPGAGSPMQNSPQPPVDAPRFDSPPPTERSSASRVKELEPRRRLPPSRPEPEPRTTTLAEELELMQRARAALERHEYAAALGILDAHADRFPSGQLVEDRRALRVVALCESGETTGTARARRAFAADYPGSHHQRRISAACEEKPEGGDGSP